MSACFQNTDLRLCVIQRNAYNEAAIVDIKIHILEGRAGEPESIYPISKLIEPLRLSIRINSELPNRQRK